MAKLLRKTLLQFGSTVDAGSEIGQFGSYISPIYTNNITTLQSGTAWARGWAAETIAVNRPFLEDMNAVDFVFGYMLSYLFQMGIAEYDAGTTYYINSYAQVSGQLYLSLQDNNLNHTPGSSPTYWSVVGSELPGVMKEYGGDVLPGGYLWCDGAAVSRSTYSDLFAICGTKFGAGNGTTTFNVPDRRNRMAVGKGSDFPNVGDTGGSKTKDMTHVHPISGTTSSDWAQDPNLTHATGTLPSSTSTDPGGSAVQDVMNPFLVCNIIIKT